MTEEQHERRIYDQHLAVLQETVARLDETTDSLRAGVNGLNRELGEVKGSIGALNANISNALSTMQETLQSNASLRADVENNKTRLARHGDRLGDLEDWRAAHVEEHRHTTFEKSLRGFLGSRLAWGISIVVSGLLGIMATKLYEVLAR